MPDVADEGLRTSLEAAIGHAAPLSSEELSSLKQLVVTGARDIAELRHCGNLEELTLFGCEIAEPAIAALPSLRILRLLASSVESLALLRGAASLVEVEVNYCLVEDITPLLSLPALRRVRMMGVPLDKNSFEDLRARLEMEPLGEGRPPVVAFSSESDWRATRQLFERGLRVCYGTLDGPYDGPLLVRPGIAKGLVKQGEIAYPTDDAVDYAETSHDAIEYAFEQAGPKPTTEQFVGTFFMQRAPVARGAARFQSTLLLGDAEDARGWVKAANMSDESRAAMLGFVERFSENIFYRDREEQFRRLAEAGIRFPMWFKLLRTRTLGFVGRDRRAQMRVDAFDIPQSPRTQYADKIWYRLSFNPIGDPDAQKLWNEACGAQPIATWPAENRSTLCLSINSQYDMRVFEAAEADLWDAKSEGGDPMQSIYTVFSSYASMLGHVVEVKVES